MPTEIERKYLVKTSHWKDGLSEVDSSLIQQGYLSVDPDRVVRVRIKDSGAFLTIKSRATGITRAEFEYPIPQKDAQELIGMCIGSVLIKRRYEVEYKGNIWEVDEFLEQNLGLIMAEIELKSEDQIFDVPEWIDKEVTEDMNYTNLALSQNAR